MEKQQRSKLQTATQVARKLLEEEFRSQLLQTYDIDVEKVRWAEEPGAHLQAEQRLIREKLIAWIEHKEAQINDRKEALLLALREMAFTALNRFVALKLMEARELVRPCVSGGLESAGFLEFTAVAQGLLADQESSYRLYLETIFEDVSRELRALFDPRDPASLLWPKRAALLELLDILNRPELAELWGEDETLGWVYQYFNGDDAKEMRDAAKGGAPRNSRELAVRNQFFTPRYVVEFLADNTLGRIWYEMRQGKTDLKDRCRYLVRRPHEIWLQPGEEPPAQPDADVVLSQEELLHQPVYIPHRPLKDPREIRMLDPACGSMHFGLYAFDLYLAIYEEAWEVAKSSDPQIKTEKTFLPFVDYAAGFVSKEAFLREAPSLILHHNIYGIDIDPRATQIARLTLWLRAQRAWQEQLLQAPDRPPITHSKVACAEPMPGERELLSDFVDQHFPEEERSLVKPLLESIFDKMQLAGESGLLLRIDEEIRSLINASRREWQDLATRQPELFSFSGSTMLPQPEATRIPMNSNLATAFWERIEERVYDALNNFANQAHSLRSFQRRLFASDTSQGLAFIDASRIQYDAILMNPPFGDFSSESQAYLKQAYGSARFDIYACFIRRCIDLLESSGYIGALTSRIGLLLFRSKEWRIECCTGDTKIDVMADLGYGVLDNAAVQVAAYTLNKSSLRRYTYFINLRKFHPASHEQELLGRASGYRSGVYVQAVEKFFKIPGSPFAYWIENEQLSALGSSLPLSQYCEIKQGIATGDNERFLRLSWELPPSPQSMWPYYNKGGEALKYYFSNHLKVSWQSSGYEMKRLAAAKYGSASRTIKNEDSFFRTGLSFPLVSKYFCVRPLPAGFIYDMHGCSIYTQSKEDLFFFMGYLNSQESASFLELLTDDRSWQVVYVSSIPLPSKVLENKSLISTLAESATRALQEIDSFNEESPIFSRTVSPCLHSAAQYNTAIDDLRNTVRKSHLEIDALCGRTASSDSGDQFLQDLELAGQVDDRCAGESVFSQMLGIIYGRWDARFFTKVFPDPQMPDPFKDLQGCSPCMLQDLEKRPAEPENVPANYPVAISWTGILADDNGNNEDIVTRMREAMDCVWNEQAKSIEHEALAGLDCRSLREYLRLPSGLFADHLRRYSKSRRQGPVYWQLSAGSGSYSAWLYYHRFTQDTLYRVLRDFIEPRIQQAEREQFELESQGALSGDAATRLQEAQILLQDLRILKIELDLVTPLWNPNLNDGVIINHAILWRITPYTPWQKKCKECWDKLVKGDYDWAHLAFHLWPERVIPKCTTDRSLAIAHGLEERLWQETNNGNWLPRQLSEADLQTLIAEHSNPAVKSALERFLAAPPPVAPTRTRASRSTRSSGSSTPRRARGSAAVVDAEATRQVLLALTAAPSDGLAKTQIADLIGVEANALTAVIKQLKESGQIDQLGERRGARYLLSEQGRAVLAADAEGDV